MLNLIAFFSFYKNVKAATMKRKRYVFSGGSYGENGPEFPRSSKTMAWGDVVETVNVFRRNGKTIEDFEQAQQQSIEEHGRPLIHQHQLDALRAIHNHWNVTNRDARNATIAVPTGTGKTGIFVLASYLLKANSVLVITPSLVTAKQARGSFCGDFAPDDQVPNTPVRFLLRKAFVFARNFFALNPRYVPAYEGSLLAHSRQLQTVAPGGQFHPERALLVANAQKFGGNSSVDIASLQRDHFDFVIVDEAHHYPASTWHEILTHFDAAKVLFVTATPQTRIWAQQEEMPVHVIYTLSLPVAIARRIIRRTDFHEMDGAVAVMQAVADTLRQRPNHRALIITNNATDAHVYTDTFNQNHGDLCRARCYAREFANERDLTAFQRWQDPDTPESVRVLFICKKLLEGFDYPHVSVLGVLRNIQRSSKVMFTQFIGRAVRRINETDDYVAEIFSDQEMEQSNNYNAYLNPVQASGHPVFDNGNDNDD